MSRKRRYLTREEILGELNRISENESEAEGSISGASLENGEMDPPQNQRLSESESSENEDGPQTSSSVNHQVQNPSGSFTGQRGRSQGVKRSTGGLNLSSPTVPQDLIVGSLLLGKDGETEWKVIDTGVTRRFSQQNILKEIPGPTAHAIFNVKEESVLTAWRLFIDNPMLQHIQLCTQAEAIRTGKENWTVSIEEIEAFIAILYARGAYGLKSANYKLLWSKIWGPAFFHQTMSKHKFEEIMRFLRFDERKTRSKRLETDKFALISATWNKFIKNCIICYNPNENITIDEQLFPTKAKCRFTQYMSNKPEKFGIKFWIAADVESKYMLNALPYLGKDDTCPSDLSVGESVVMRLMNPYLNSGRNVTTNNFFTSVKLAKKLKEKQTSLVGTMNRNRREVPISVKVMKSNLYQTDLLSHDNMTLTIYRSKKKKNVLVLSSLHPNVEIDSGENKLPESIEFYNHTKFGVDTVDQMARMYSVKAGSRRWPVHVFYNILDLAALNAWVIYKEITCKTISRHQFILRLAEELREKHSWSNPSPVCELGARGSDMTRKRRQCQVAKCRHNKTSDLCIKCKRFVCGTCTKNATKVITCIDCGNDVK